MSRNDDKETMTMLRADFSPGETLIIDGTRLTITWISGDKVGLKIESSEQIEAPDNTVVQSGNVVLFPRLK